MDKDQAMKVMAESHRETVKELKESIEGHIKVKRVLARKLHAARKENDRYREALEFYADFYKYNYGGDADAMKKVRTSVITDDSGEVARQALEGDPHESS